MSIARPLALLAGLLAPALLLAGCGDGTAHAAGVAPPIVGCESAYACAEAQGLADRAPDLGLADLHNVYRLSPSIVSGGEPLTAAALERIAAMGVKTLLSVDGKAPDAATARALGMRYVHVPIRYNGITTDEVAKIVKTFRELDGPFYVHCFHGKHRGPAAAVLGRMILDGISRETALAEMKRCGTAAKYEGLYRTVATGHIPGADESKAFEWGFDEAQPLGGVRAGMVRMTRSFDEVEAAETRGWAVDPEHPDISARNETAKVLQLLEQMASEQLMEDRPADYREWMVQSVAATRKLHEALVAVEAGTEGAVDAARAHYEVVKDLCSKCHKPYRNN